MVADLAEVHDAGQHLVRHAIPALLAQYVLHVPRAQVVLVVHPLLRRQLTKQHLEGWKR